MIARKLLNEIFTFFFFNFIWLSKIKEWLCIPNTLLIDFFIKTQLFKYLTINISK